MLLPHSDDQVEVRRSRIAWLAAWGRKTAVAPPLRGELVEEELRFAGGDAILWDKFMPFLSHLFLVLALILLHISKPYQATARKSTVEAGQIDAEGKTWLKFGTQKKWIHDSIPMDLCCDHYNVTIFPSMKNGCIRIPCVL